MGHNGAVLTRIDRNLASRPGERLAYDFDAVLLIFVLGLNTNLTGGFYAEMGNSVFEAGHTALSYYGAGTRRVAAPPLSFDAARCDRILSSDATAFNHTPARRFQRGINVFGSVPSVTGSMMVIIILAPQF